MHVAAPAVRDGAHPDLGPVIDESGVMFRLPDPDRTLSAVWLVQEVAWPRSGPEFERSEGGAHWQVRLPRPDVDRMEYLFELLHVDGRSEHVPDPLNPVRSRGPFGDKSVVEFPGYRRPGWLAVDGPAGDRRELRAPTTLGEMRVALWSSPGSDQDASLPLLVVHDGVEYAELSDLAVLLDRRTAQGRLPAMRAALLHPSTRDEHYSASPRYADVLGTELLPWLRTVAPSPRGRRMRVGMGASLGALAMLHAHRLHPAAFGGLFLQSGSFFHHRYDRAELGFEHFQRIRWFMDRLHASREWHLPPTVTITCGRVEQNHANNRATSLALRRQGYPVRFSAVRDAHNWVGWRDAFEPGLVDLLQELWQ